MPDVTYPSLSIRTTYSDVAAEEIENTITKPIEEALAAIADVEHINSTSSEGSSRVTLNFSWGKDMESAAADVREKIDRVKSQLPEDADAPVLFKFDLSAFPIMFLGVESNMNANDLQEYIENKVQYRIERIPGVASIDIRGGYAKEIQIFLDKTKIEQLNISLSEIVSVIKSNNINQPAGYVKEGRYDIILRSTGQFTGVEDIKNRVIKVINGMPIFVKDIATVNFTIEKVKQITKINGKPGVRISISKQSGANTVEVADAITEEIKRINEDMPFLKIFPLIDTSKYIKNSIDSVKSSAIYGAVLAIFVLLVFLRNFRSTIIISISIPVSIIATFILIYNGGFTLNIMSFGGLALGMGMLLDNSIVVLENTFRHISEEKLDKKNGAIVGASEVGSAILSSTLTTIVVFLPMIFITGMSGIMFKQIAYVVTFSLICSMGAAFTIVPMLSSKYLTVYSDEDLNKKKTSLTAKFFWFTEKIFRRIDFEYGNLLKWSLNHKKIVIGFFAVMLGLSLLLIKGIGTEFMPSSDEGELRVSVEGNVGTKVEIMKERLELIETIIQKEIKEVENTTSSVGGGGGPGGDSGHTGNIRIKLFDKKIRKRSSEEIARELNQKLAKVEGVKCRIRTSSGLFIMRRMSSGDDKLSVEIRGHDLDTGKQLAEKMSKLFEKVEGITDVKVSRESGRPEKLIVIDYEKTAKLGLDPSDINNFIDIGLGGKTATYFRAEGKEYKVLVQFDNAEYFSDKEILNTLIPLPNGGKTPLGNIIKIEEKESPLSIERIDQERVITVSANYQFRDLGSIVKDVQNIINHIPTPKDFNIVIGGEYEDQQKAFQEMIFVFALALALVYMVMASQFESLLDPFIVLFSVPLSVIGVILILVLTDTLFNIQGFIGAIMLAGIVVNNAIILVDYTNLLIREHKMDLYEAVILAGRRRLRPILMTSLTTILGLIPLAIGIGEGTEMQTPLARTVCGGLSSSTLITLILIPVMYVLFNRKYLKKNRAQSDTNL